MPTLEKTYTVEEWGKGTPDYTKEVSLGRVRPGITLKYRQSLMRVGRTFSDTWSPYPYITAPLAAGAIANLIDYSTGLELPLTIVKGYLYSMVQIAHSANCDFHLHATLDGFYVGDVGLSAGGIPYSDSQVAPFGTQDLDPTGLADHQVGVTIENLSGGLTLYGSVSIYGIAEEVGTPPPPPIKTVQCKFCKHQWPVPRETEGILCPNCGQLNIYACYDKVRRM